MAVMGMASFDSVFFSSDNAFPPLWYDAQAWSTSTEWYIQYFYGLVVFSGLVLVLHQLLFIYLCSAALNHGLAIGMTCTRVLTF